jgi:hypothetical protein
MLGFSAQEEGRRQGSGGRFYEMVGGAKNGSWAALKTHLWQFYDFPFLPGQGLCLIEGSIFYFRGYNIPLRSALLSLRRGKGNQDFFFFF